MKILNIKQINYLGKSLDDLSIDKDTYTDFALIRNNWFCIHIWR